MLERGFQKDFIDLLERSYPGSMVMKLDSAYIQGIPDLLFLYGDFWGTFEVKRSLREPYQPNQEWYIDSMNNMSFSVMVCPENVEDVLHALQVALRARRNARVPFRQ